MGALFVAKARRGLSQAAYSALLRGRRVLFEGKIGTLDPNIIQPVIAQIRETFVLSRFASSGPDGSGPPPSFHHHSHHHQANIQRLYQRVGGGRRISKQIRELIFQMVAENPSWGAPRIHGELLMLGLDVSERTISRWMKCAPKDPEPAKRWLAFLRTITFGVLYFSSLPMTAGASYTSTSPSIPRACGSSSSCERRFRLIWLLGFSSSIGMPSTDWKSRPRFDP